MKIRRINPFKDSSEIKEGLHPMIYAYALTGNEQKARELVYLIKLVKEMGPSFNEDLDDEWEIFRTTGKLTR